MKRLFQNFVEKKAHFYHSFFTFNGYYLNIPDKQNPNKTLFHFLTPPPALPQRAGCFFALKQLAFCEERIIIIEEVYRKRRREDGTLARITTSNECWCRGGD
ncbi:hypothetical protein EY685_09790 [Enterococcus faecalis]|nr:hypothetical protein [Enterococcus faecalis]